MVGVQGNASRSNGQLTDGTCGKVEPLGARIAVRVERRVRYGMNYLG